MDWYLVGSQMDKDGTLGSHMEVSVLWKGMWMLVM